MGVHFKQPAQGFTIIEVILFFGITGALMLGVMGSASVGVNTQRYNDAVNTFASVLQQEFTNATNVVNTQSVRGTCSITSPDPTRGTSSCFIIGRLMTVNTEGEIVRSNVITTTEPGLISPADTELTIIKKYTPTIDSGSQETDQMSWGTRIEKTSAPSGGWFASVLIVRSPQSGNINSYVIKSNSNVISTPVQLREAIDTLEGRNANDQYLCVDRSGWVLSTVRAIKLAPYTSGPSGVSTVDAPAGACN